MLAAVLVILAIVGLVARGASGPTPQSQTGDAAASGGGILDSLSQGFAHFEGFYTPGSLAQRTNNPGDVGTYGGKVQSYSDVSQGWASLQSWLSGHYQAHPGWNLNQLVTDYLTGSPSGQPGANQNPQAYASYVANYAGVDPTQPLFTYWGQ